MDCAFSGGVPAGGPAFPTSCPVGDSVDERRVEPDGDDALIAEVLCRVEVRRTPGPHGGTERSCHPQLVARLLRSPRHGQTTSIRPHSGIYPKSAPLPLKARLGRKWR